MAYLLLTSLIISSIAGSVFSQPEVTTSLGTIFGRTFLFKESSYLNISRNIDVYKGIPYAEPPVGNLKFEKPVPKTQWTGMLNATEYGAMCLQSELPYLISGQDDCLYLNVFVPHSKPANAAVMVFIHGGGFSTGTGSTDEYSGKVLAATGDVIVVTINYRLNFYGFLTTGDEHYPGNVGLFDQVEALKWVNQNIGAFGGDPSRVTIFGESAGSASVDYHLISKLSWNYFSQAILESGVTLSPFAYQEKEVGKYVAITIGEKVGCEFTNSQSFVACMRLVDPVDIYTASVGMTVGPLPVIDGVFLEDSPQNLIRNKDFKKNATIIFGTNKDEGTLFFLSNPIYFKPETPMISKPEFRELIPLIGLPEAATNPYILDSVDFEYTDWTIADNPDANYFQSFVELHNDFWFACPQDKAVRAHVSVENKVYTYVLTHAPNVSVYAYYGLDYSWIGAGHGEELQFVFGLPFLEEASLYNSDRQPSVDDRKVAVQYLRYWTNFAKTGDPNNKGSETSGPSFDEDLAKWPVHTIPGLDYLDINVMSNSDRAYLADNCAYWNSYKPKLDQFTADLSETEELWRNDYYSWKYNALPQWQEAFDDYKKNQVCT